MNLSQVYQWSNELATYLPSLNSWQIENLALFSYGVVLSESSQLMAIARKIAEGEQVESTEKRLRRFIGNEKWSMPAFFSDWTAWVMKRLESSDITLMVDETKLHGHMKAMVVGVAYEKRCIPLIWRCYGEVYPEEGQVELIHHLLQQIKGSIPKHQRVLVLADRGIGTSPKLCQAVDDLGWKYLFRVTCQSKIITQDGEFTIYEQVREGENWQASGLVFKKRGRIPAHARALWEKGYSEPWALVTNDATLTGYEYARRNWQEQSFRDLKSGGWHWASSHVRCPERMTRLLAILVIAYSWVLSIGAYAVHWQQARPLTRRKDGSLRRQWSLFKEGLHYFTQYLLRHNRCLTLCFVSDKRLC